MPLHFAIRRKQAIVQAMFRKISIFVLSVFFIIAGANHFIAADVYLPLIPPYLPWPLGLVYLSGIAEILGGVAIAFSRTRWLGGWWLIAVLVAVFPANIHMLMNHVPLGGKEVPTWVFWARLPLQFLLIYWIYVTCSRGSATKRHGLPGN